MTSTRKIAVITGVLFILATFTGPLLATPLTPDLTGVDYLTRVSAQPNQAAGGVLLWIISAFTGGGIAIAMYPVLKERNAAWPSAPLYSGPLKRSFTWSGSCACCLC